MSYHIISHHLSLELRTGKVNVRTCRYAACLPRKQKYCSAFPLIHIPYIMDFERQIDLDNVESRKRHATEGDEDSDEEEDEEEDEGDEDDEIDVASQRRPSDALLVPRGDLSQLLGPSVEQVFGDRGAARKRTKRRIKRRTGGTEGKVLPAEQTEKLREAAMKYVLGDAQGVSSVNSSCIVMHARLRLALCVCQRQWSCTSMSRNIFPTTPMHLPLSPAFTKMKGT
jgi:hypothetical protein